MAVEDDALMRAALAITLFLTAASAWAQVTPPADSQAEPMTTLKVATRVVAISAVVKSKDGEIKGGMTRDDFILKQDGKEVPIRYFSQGSELPLTLALMVDTSGSQRTFIGDETLASDVFFETMLGRKEDRAMLVQFDTQVLQLHNLTNSPNVLHLALLSLSSRASAVGGTLLDDAVWAVSQGVLAKETGRKAIILLTDGGDNGSRHSLAEAVEQAQRADVQVYSILYSLAESSGRFSGGIGVVRSESGLATLQKLSESTGGRVFTVSQKLSLREIFAEISRDLRLQYEIGYTPSADVQPNTYHTLELKPKDKKLNVQARKGFFAR